MIKTYKVSDLCQSLRRALGTALILFVMGLFNGTQGSNLSPHQISLIKLAQSWLNGLETLQAAFTQTTPSGSMAVGHLEIIRPGSMRIEYQTPDGLQIFADGTWLIYIDHNLKEVNQVPIKLTPARVLLEEKIDLMREASVRVEENKTNFRLTLLQKGNTEDGDIILVFQKNPTRLISWVVNDPHGIQTTVSLDDISINIPIERASLIYSPPDWAFD